MSDEIKVAAPIVVGLSARIINQDGTVAEDLGELDWKPKEPETTVSDDK